MPVALAGIVAPVSICMALTVLLVRVLNPSGDSETTAVFIASAFYSEKVGDHVAMCRELLKGPACSTVLGTTHVCDAPFDDAQADDSTGTKLAGSLINALIFVIIVAAMTFVLFLLFKYGVRPCMPHLICPLCTSRSSIMQR